MKNIITTTLLLLAGTMAYAQHPVEGALVPDFTLSKVKGYHKNKITASDLRGKWVVMDFWNKGCTACVKGFPKMNKLQQRFGDSIQIILVGQTHIRWNKGIEEAYQVYKQSQNLQLVNAYDSVIFEQFGIDATPHVVILDPAGKVVAITSASSVTEENLQAMISNGKPVFSKARNRFYQPPPAPVWAYRLTDQQKQQRDFTRRSVLSQYNGEEYLKNSYQFDQRFFEFTSGSLNQVLNFLYGPLLDAGPDSLLRWPLPLPEIADTTMFKEDFNTRKGYYNYSFAVADTQMPLVDFRQLVLADIQQYFPYEVSAEIRMMPYWSLTLEPGAEKRLKTKNGPWMADFGPERIFGDNIRVEDMLTGIRTYYYHQPMPMVNETNYIGRIDIRLMAALADIDAVRKALKSWGFNLEEKRRPMKVLVVRDLVPVRKI